MSERVAIPIYWSFENDTDMYIANWESLNKKYLAEGWEVERVDKLKDANRPVLMYILKKENN